MNRACETRPCRDGGIAALVLFGIPGNFEHASYGTAVLSPDGAYLPFRVARLRIGFFFFSASNLRIKFSYVSCTCKRENLRRTSVFERCRKNDWKTCVVLEGRSQIVTAKNARLGRKTTRRSNFSHVFTSFIYLLKFDFSENPMRNGKKPHRIDKISRFYFSWYFCGLSYGHMETITYDLGTVYNYCSGLFHFCDNNTILVYLYSVLCSQSFFISIHLGCN